MPKASQCGTICVTVSICVSVAIHRSFAPTRGIDTGVQWRKSGWNSVGRMELVGALFHPTPPGRGLWTGKINFLLERSRVW